MIEILLALAPILVVATALLATPLGLPALSWLVGNPVGRIVALIGVAVMTAWIIYQIGLKVGVDRIQAQQTQRNLDALRDRIAVDTEIRKMPADQRREELSKWVR